jgi:hypothetical protein
MTDKIIQALVDRVQAGKDVDDRLIDGILEHGGGDLSTAIKREQRRMLLFWINYALQHLPSLLEGSHGYSGMANLVHHAFSLGMTLDSQQTEFNHSRQFNSDLSKHSGVNDNERDDVLVQLFRAMRWDSVGQPHASSFPMVLVDGPLMEYVSDSGYIQIIGVRNARHVCDRWCKINRVHTDTFKMEGELGMYIFRILHSKPDRPGYHLVRFVGYFPLEHVKFAIETWELESGIRCIDDEARLKFFDKKVVRDAIEGHLPDDYYNIVSKSRREEMHPDSMMLEWAVGQTMRMMIHAPNVTREEGYFFGEFARGSYFGDGEITSVEDTIQVSTTGPLDMILTPTQFFSPATRVVNAPHIVLVGFAVFPKYGPLSPLLDGTGWPAPSNRAPLFNGIALPKMTDEDRAEIRTYDDPTTPPLPLPTGKDLVLHFVDDPVHSSRYFFS